MLTMTKNGMRTIIDPVTGEEGFEHPCGCVVWPRGERDVYFCTEGHRPESPAPACEPAATR
jgi:hypothetical protein